MTTIWSEFDNNAWSGYAKDILYEKIEETTQAEKMQHLYISHYPSDRNKKKRDTCTVIPFCIFTNFTSVHTQSSHLRRHQDIFFRPLFQAQPLRHPW